jgi:hypothetical protein
MTQTKYEKYGRTYYENNRAKCIERNRIQQVKWKQQWHDYKASLACAHCNASHPAIIDFHHVNSDDPDKKHVNELIKNRRYALAYKEVKEKCVVLCANCHRIHHYEEKKSPNASGIKEDTESE